MNSKRGNQQDSHPHPSDAAARPSWMGAWYAAPMRMRPAHLTGRTLYQVVSLHAGGRQIRLRLSNRYGDKALRLTSVFVGRPTLGLPLHEGAAYPVLFDGQETVTMEAGASIVSDPITLEVEEFSNLAISCVVAEGDILTGHFFAAQTSYVSAPGVGSTIIVPEELLPTSPRMTMVRWITEIGELLPTYPLLTASWWALTGVEVLPEKPGNVVITLGDSTTDGVGSTLNANKRYPDALAHRLAEASAPRSLSVLNAGIGWNELLAAHFPVAGEATLDRLVWDVLEQAAVTDLIVQIGINDLFQNTSASAIITGLQQLATRAREHPLRVFGSTILPCSYTSEQAVQWRIVNTWLREQGTQCFDGVFDFATALRHPEDETKPDPTYNSGDGVHPNDLGYQRMAETVDLTQLAAGPAL